MTMTHDLPPGPPRRPLRALPPIDDEWIPPDDAATPVVASEIPPRDDLRDAERAVLGAMLTSQRARDLVAQTLLASTDFHDWRHEFIAHAINRHAGPVDPITIGHSLAQTSDLPRVGGQAYLHELVQWAAVPETAEYLATKVIKPAAQRRRAAKALTSALDKATNGGDDLAGILEAARVAIDAELEDVTDGAPSTPWTPVDINAILAGDMTTPTATILGRRDGKRLLYPSAVHSISGEPGSAKTWVALVATVQEITAGNHVLYLDFEDRPQSIISKLIALGADPTHLAERLHYANPDVALSPSTSKTVLDIAALCSLAVIDGITEAMSMHGLEVNSNDDAAKWDHLLPRPLARLGCAVLQIDHVTKNPDTRSRYSIGAQHKLAAITGTATKSIVVKPLSRGGRGQFKIIIDKDKHGDVGPVGSTIADLHIDATDQDRILAWLGTPELSHDEQGNFRPTILMSRISTYLLTQTEGATQKNVRANVPGSNNAKIAALESLAREGFVRTEPGPRGALVYHLVSHFEETS